jgi:poly(3-hydroxybutyrate) depolymerase
VAWLFAVCAEAASLPSYNVDLAQTSASGISSGGFMGVQLHLAHSEIINGVGVFAGGPYDCARGSLERAVDLCLAGRADADGAIARTLYHFQAGSIDDPANLADDKVWLFSGYNDGVVRQGTVDALRDYYRHFVVAGNVFYRDDLGAGHAQITQDFGAACAATGGRFINDCDYDAAGALMQHIYGRLAPNADGELGGQILDFAQAEFAAGDPGRSGLAATGYVYVPAACAAGTRCRVHVALHGCLQNAEKIGDAFYRHAGYNEWADENRIIVLYPQTTASHFAPVNPQACWDWWGFTDGRYATRAGRQIRAVRAMLDRLAAAEPTAAPAPDASVPVGPPADLTVIDRADDEVALAWTPVTAASGYNVYRAEDSDADYARLNDLAVDGASYADTGLKPQTGYRYAVSAIGAQGESERSPPLQVTTGRRPPPCDPYFANNFTHALEGRAYVLFGRTYARGSNEPMGWWNLYTHTSLYRDGSGYHVGTCPMQ